MKLKEFVKMFKNCSLLKEQEESSTETVKCFGKKGHDTSFEEMVSLIFQYASDNNLASYAFDVSQMTGDTCSIELFELIKKVQKDLGFTGSAVDGIAGKNTLAALKGEPISTSQVPAKPTTAQPPSDRQVTQGKDISDISGPEILIIGDSTSHNIVVANPILQRGDHEKRMGYYGKDGTRYDPKDFGGSHVKALAAAKKDGGRFIFPGYTGHASHGGAGTTYIKNSLIKLLARDESYIPKVAIVSMGYNDPPSVSKKGTSINNFKAVISALKERGVKDIRIIEPRADKGSYKRNADLIRPNIYSLADDIVKIVPNPTTQDGGPTRHDGVHYTRSGARRLFKDAMSGLTVSSDAQPTTKTPEKQIKISSTAGSVKVAGSGFPGFISKSSSGSTVKVLSPFGSFNEVMNSVTEIFKAAAKKLNLNISDDPTVQDLRNLQRKLGISADGSFGPTTMAAISLINSKYANVVSENSANAINLRPNITGSFRGVIEESLTGLLQERTMFGVIDVDDYVENYASASALKKAYQGAINKRLNVSKPPMNNRYAKKDTSWREDKEFLKSIKEYSNRNGVDPKVFLAIMAHETAGTFSPYMVNHIGCTGLIQFCPNSGMKTVGKNQQQLSEMTRAEQWKMVEKFYDKSRSRWANSGSDFATMYLITFSPAFATLPDDAIIYAKDPSRAHPYVRKISSRKTIARAWKQNPANRDPADNTIIRKKSMGAKVKGQIRKFNITDELFEV